MAYQNTDTGYNMFDMLSMLQKAIRRGDFDNAGFAANQLKNSYRKAMWNRLVVITAEDCFGVITKEIIKLREDDERIPSDRNIGNAVALMCRAQKSRDACYFACNFILTSRRPREINVSQTEIDELYMRIRRNNNDCDAGYYRSGFWQMSLLDYSEQAPPTPSGDSEKFRLCAELQAAISHKDMDMIGCTMDALRHKHRNSLWDAIVDFSNNQINHEILSEILALRKADDTINNGKTEKDEIFISKAVILLCQCSDTEYALMNSCDIISMERSIDWTTIWTKPITECILVGDEIPEWVYDCHTLKGKKMGKTDWDMTTTEQQALYPLRRGYFDNASWIYAYEQDLKDGVIKDTSCESRNPLSI